MPDSSHWNLVVVKPDHIRQETTAALLANIAGDFHIHVTSAAVKGGRDIDNADAIIILAEDVDFAGIEAVCALATKPQAAVVVLLVQPASPGAEQAALRAGVDLVLPAAGLDAPLLGSLLRSILYRKRKAQPPTGEHRSVASESEERFHHMADSMPQLVWTAHADGVVDYYNQRYREFFGIRPDTLQEDVWQWAPSLHPDDVDVTVAAWNTAVQNGTVYEIEHRVTMADGSYRWYLSRGLPYRNERGEIVKWFGTATDIHDQKMAEQALRESETRFRRLMDSNIVGVFFARGDGLIDEANQAFLDMIGCSREDMRAGKLRWSEIIAPQALNQERAYLQQALRDGASGLHELNYIYNEGNPVPVLVGYAALANQGTDFVCFTLELSQQKEAERALEQYAARLEESNRNLEQFAYAASHDLQEPLRKIQSFGEILNQRVAHKLDADEADILARVRTSAKRLWVMIDSLLSLSRISSRTRTFSRINTNALVQEVLADLEISIHTHHARVRVDSIPDLYGDPSQIHQLLQNLIGNAIKFHLPSKPPQVTVSGSSVSDTQVEIRVQDDGIGFSTAHLERMFRPFERLQPRSEYEGVGMGLAICSRIVERHAGTITAQSEPGKGSTFIVTLPKADRLDPGE